MIIVTLDGVVQTEVRLSQTRSGMNRAEFIIECVSPGSLPLRFSVVTLGTTAQYATDLRPGTRILCYGRMSSGGRDKRVSIIASYFETLSAAENIYDFEEENGVSNEQPVA
jgi:primosomal replication protein N